MSGTTSVRGTTNLAPALLCALALAGCDAGCADTDAGGGDAGAGGSDGGGAGGDDGGDADGGDSDGGGARIVLVDDAGGLVLVSAPDSLPLLVGHVSYLGIEVQGHHRPVTVTARTLIHTWVEEATPEAVGEAGTIPAGVLAGPETELAVQTLRLRPHELTLELAAGDDHVEVPLRLEPAVDRAGPLFGMDLAVGIEGDAFDDVWGPECDRCDPDWEGCMPCEAGPGEPAGTTRDRACAKSHHRWDGCHCRHAGNVPNVEGAAAGRAVATDSQRYAAQFVRNQSGTWTGSSPVPGEYLWERLDWLFDDLRPEERDYSPLLGYLIEGHAGWMVCPDIAPENPDGSRGFFHPDNPVLNEQFAAYVGELAGRYAPELQLLETMNEPSYSFYLCPCRDVLGPGGESTCLADGGPNQPVCDDVGPDWEQPHFSQGFAETYGPFLLESARIAAEAMAEANPEARLVAGALEASGYGLSATTRWMIDGGLLDPRGPAADDAETNVVVMIHQFPYYPFYHDWIDPPPEEIAGGCGYLPDTYYGLNDGCETAPPLEDYVVRRADGTTVTVLARRNWYALDEAIDVSEILDDVEEAAVELADPGLPERFRLFDTELHGGFFVKDPTTNAGRTNLAGLRIGAINAHQRFAGMEFIGPDPNDPLPYNLLVKHLTGASPVHTARAPLRGADYSDLVYKLFTRAIDGGPWGEDVIAFWSNADGARELLLGRSAGETNFRRVTWTRFAAHASPQADCSGLRPQERELVDAVETQVTDLPDGPPEAVVVEPLYEFHFLSVISDRPGFGWLADP